MANITLIAQCDKCAEGPNDPNCPICLKQGKVAQVYYEFGSAALSFLFNAIGNASDKLEQIQEEFDASSSDNPGT